MKLEISGHQVAIGRSFRDYIAGKLQDKIKRFFGNVISVQVMIGKSGNFFSSEIIINEGIGHRILKADAIASDVHSAFDESLHKMKAQLSKHKQQRLESRRKKRKAIESEGEV